MGFWRNLWKSKEDEPEQFISFGRFSDANKDKAQYVAWDKAMELFESGNFFDSIIQVFEYLKNKNASNIFWESKHNRISFSLFQGSKILEGVVTDHTFRAQVLIAKCKELKIGFLRRAIEKSFDMNYGRYALDNEDRICVVFDSTLPEASPYKLYNGLKEIAIHADDEDDILINEFVSLEAINNQHVVDLPKEIVDIKLAWIRRSITMVLKEDVLSPLNTARYPGALSYMFLSTLYKIDYLAKPEGLILDAISEMHDQYFNAGQQDIATRIKFLKDGFTKLSQLTDDAIAKELYDVISTFGITNPVKHNTIQSIIENEIKALSWYEENKHEFVCQAICDYIVGYCLFNYAMADPVREIFHLYFQIMEADYFRQLQIDVPYWSDTGDIKLKEIRMSIDAILESHSSAYPNMALSIPLDGTSKFRLAKSILLNIRSFSI